MHREYCDITAMRGRVSHGMRTWKVVARY